VQPVATPLALLAVSGPSGVIAGRSVSAALVLSLVGANVWGALLRRSAMKCTGCQKDAKETTLQKCPICFAYVCLDCGSREYGRTFCSKRCADQFFFVDDEEDNE
jgi:hypothetical protein